MWVQTPIFHWRGICHQRVNVICWRIGSSRILTASALGHFFCLGKQDQDSLRRGKNVEKHVYFANIAKITGYLFTPFGKLSWMVTPTLLTGWLSVQNKVLQSQKWLLCHGHLTRDGPARLADNSVCIISLTERLTSWRAILFYSPFFRLIFSPSPSQGLSVYRGHWANTNEPGPLTLERRRHVMALLVAHEINHVCMSFAEPRL